MRILLLAIFTVVCFTGWSQDVWLDDYGNPTVGLYFNQPTGEIMFYNRLTEKCFKFIDGEMVEVDCSMLTPTSTETPLKANTPTPTVTHTPIILPTSTPLSVDPEPPVSVTGLYTEKDLDMSYKNGFIDGVKYVLSLQWLFGG